MHEFVVSLHKNFDLYKNPAIASGQKAYMRNQFDFLGIKTPERKKLISSLLKKESLPQKKSLKEIIKKLWEFPEREYQYAAIDVLSKYKNKWEEKDIDLIEYLIQKKSWWDTVDALAIRLAGNFFENFPDLKNQRTEKWIRSKNIWLQRSALLFQLKYKHKTDIRLMEYAIGQLKNTDEFFLNKAIGWILREYGKTNPEWVKNFVVKNKLHPLSQREALKIIGKSQF